MIQFLREKVATGGELEVQQTITLSNARVSDFLQYVGDDARWLEDVAFIFQKIEIVNNLSQKMAVDSVAGGTPGGAAAGGAAAAPGDAGGGPAGAGGTPGGAAAGGAAAASGDAGGGPAVAGGTPGGATAGGAAAAPGDTGGGPGGAGGTPGGAAAAEYSGTPVLSPSCVQPATLDVAYKEQLAYKERKAYKEQKVTPSLEEIAALYVSAARSDFGAEGHSETGIAHNPLI